MGPALGNDPVERCMVLSVQQEGVLVLDTPSTIATEYGIDGSMTAQVYVSPSPYNDAFEETMDIHRLGWMKHRAAGLMFTTQGDWLILSGMASHTPGSRIHRWASRLRGAWLISIDGTPVHTTHDVYRVFEKLYHSNDAKECTLLFSHPEIKHGLSNRGVPLLHREHLPQTMVDQLNN